MDKTITTIENLKKKTDNSVGKNIRTLRHQRGWSQEDVANRLGISIPAFSKIETGVTDVNLSRLEQIANAFEVNIVSLLSSGEDESMPGITPLIDSLKRQLAENEAEILKLQRKVIQLYEELHGMGQGLSAQAPA